MEAKMEISPRLYVGDSVNNPDRLIRRLKRRSRIQNAWIITLAPGRDQLEIYHAGVLAQKCYRYRRFDVVGVAGGYEEAVSLVVRITEACLESRGDCDLKAYLEEARST